MKRLIILSALTILLCSCHNLDEKIKGGWVVDQAYYNNKVVIWDLYTNSLNLKDNNNCELPPINRLSERSPDETIGKWKLYKENGKLYLQINTTNKIFNRTFEIQKLRKEKDTISWGDLLKMTILSDSLKMECTKAIF